MNEQSEKELKMLIEKRWDPRRGYGKRLGKVEGVLGMAMAVLLIPSCMSTKATQGVGLLFLIPLSGLVICWLWEREMKAKITKRVKATEGFLCPWCQYPFTGLDEEGKCPECGAGYRKELCEELYQNVFRSFQPDPHELAMRESKAWREAIELRDGSSSL
tara:strand:+ start:891 stop:1370 length:480 start_codon:yes stop_codon:yes gene_type:complete